MSHCGHAGKNRTRLLGSIVQRDDAVEDCPANSSRHFDREFRTSTPISCMDSTVMGLRPAGWVPALSTSKWSPAIRPRRASAIWLRAEFPVQRNRIRCFMIGHVQQLVAQHAAWLATGLDARTKPLTNLPSTRGAITSTSTPVPLKRSRASWAV